MEAPKREINVWKWGGLFYYNPKNPDLFVDKRVGVGQTFNFAHRKAWYIFFFLILFPLIGILFILLLS